MTVNWEGLASIESPDDQLHMLTPPQGAPNRIQSLRIQSYPSLFLGLDRKGHVTIHSLRHSFAGTAENLGASIPTIAALLGHRLNGVTGGYILIGSPALAGVMVSPRPLPLPRPWLRAPPSSRRVLSACAECNVGSDITARAECNVLPDINCTIWRNW